MTKKRVITAVERYEIKTGIMGAAYIYDLVDEFMTAYVAAYEHNPQEAKIAMEMGAYECLDRLKNIPAGPGLTELEKFGFRSIRKTTKH